MTGEKNVYSVDNSYEVDALRASRARPRSLATGRRLPDGDGGPSGGFLEAVNQIDDDNGTRSDAAGTGRSCSLRHSYMYLDNKTFGEVRWGLTATPKDDITKDTDVTELEDTMTLGQSHEPRLLPAAEGFRHRVERSRRRRRVGNSPEVAEHFAVL